MKAAEGGLRILGAPYGEYGWCRQWLKEHGDGVLILATGFANQRGNAVMLLEANSRRRSQRANHRHASG